MQWFLILTLSDNTLTVPPSKYIFVLFMSSSGSMKKTTKQNLLLCKALQISGTAPFSFDSGDNFLRYSYLTRFVSLLWYFHLEDTSPWNRKEHLLCLPYPQESFPCFRRKLRQLYVIFFFSLRQIPSVCCNSRSLQGWMTCSSIFPGIEIKLDNLEKNLKQALCKRKDRTKNRQARPVLWPCSLIPNKTHTDNCATRALQLCL